MSWSLKKWLFGSGGWTKQYRFLVTSGCLLSRKVWWAVWIGSFWPKIEVFYRPEWTKGGTTWKWILSIFKFRNEYYKQLDQKKYMKKMGSFVLFPCFIPELRSLNSLKKCIFCSFVLTSTRNLGLLKQFTYMHVEGLVTHFQKMVLLCYDLLFWRY